MNTLKTTFLMALLMVLAVGIGFLLGGRGGMMIAFLFALGGNVFSYWFSDKIVLKMYRAKPATETEQPRLYNMVRELTHRASLPMPKVYIIPSDTPNAFATGRNPEHAVVAVTRGILRILDENELRGVLGHDAGIYGTMGGDVWLRWWRRASRRPVWLAGDNHLCADCRDVDPDGYFALTRIPRRRDRRQVSR